MKKQGYKLKLPKAAKITAKVKHKARKEMARESKPVKDIVGGYKPRKPKSQVLSF